MPTALFRYISSLLVLAAFAGTADAEPQTFQVVPGKPNLVTFTSKAPLETVVGHTELISGWIKVDPGNLAASPTGEFEVDMASLDTDNRIRNGHMRDNHLHTKQYPTSRFVLKGLGEGAPVKLPDGSPVTFTTTGDFTCHGVTNSITPQVTVIWNAGSRTLDVTAKFSVILDDYSIPLPQFLVMKLEKKQDIVIRFIAHAD